MCGISPQPPFPFFLPRLHRPPLLQSRHRLVAVTLAHLLGLYDASLRCWLTSLTLPRSSTVVVEVAATCSKVRTVLAICDSRRWFATGGRPIIGNNRPFWPIIVLPRRSTQLCAPLGAGAFFRASDLSKLRRSSSRVRRWPRNFNRRRSKRSPAD